MIGVGIGGLSLAVWLYLFLAHGGFWLARERDDGVSPFPLKPSPAEAGAQLSHASPAGSRADTSHGNWSPAFAGEGDKSGRRSPPLPSVVAIVPARDEAEVIARSIGSLLRQDYPGPFRVIVVDDNSTDGTAEIARSALDALPSSPAKAGAQLRPVSRPETHADIGHRDGALAFAGEGVSGTANGNAHPLTVLPGAPLPAGWTGKLWAVSQGVTAAGSPDYLWLTDADIDHAPATLAALVARAEADGRVLVSLMALLRCDTPAERALIPAFVFFFQMLYPFARVNRPGRTAGAAGGCMLVRRESLDAAGGVAAIRGALIDDCAFGALLKAQGSIWLGLTRRSRSIRPYGTYRDVAAMISRSAYAQLGYSPVQLAGTILGLLLVYAAPPALALFGQGLAQAFGLAAWTLIALSFQPTLRFYRRSPLWGVALPLIAGFYAACTLLSAAQHHRGRGGMWKGRAQAAAGQ